LADLSSPPNPEFQSAIPDAVLPPPVRRGEDPPLNGWGILSVLTVGAASFFVTSASLVLGARSFLYHGQSAKQIVQEHPLLSVAAQVVTYALVLAFTVALVKKSGQGFWQALRWNWPTAWWTYLGWGVVLAFGLGVLQHLLRLPMPEHPPVDRFFQTRQDVWVLVFFGTLLAPLMEELFFRGLLYPLLARWMGVYAGIVITSVLFGLVHAAQLAFSWGPVLVISIVGLVLTTVRALAKSLAASMLIHCAYNATLFTAMYFATDGFRHLENFS